MEENHPALTAVRKLAPIVVWAITHHNAGTLPDVAEHVVMILLEMIIDAIEKRRRPGK